MCVRPGVVLPVGRGFEHVGVRCSLAIKLTPRVSVEEPWA